LIEETYPSGRVVKNTLGSDGQLLRVQSKKNANYGFHTYAGSFTYDSSGAVTKMQLGNGSWETASYNNRLQIMQIGLGTTDSTQNLLKLELGYGNNQQNNGSLRSQKISFDGLANSFDQTYTYDDLNRLQVAEEKVVTTTTWKQTFIIDRYGNRRFDAANTTTLDSCTEAVCNPTISTSNNRISSSGYSFDANGNVTQDAEGKQFLYDAENHQKEVKDSQNTTIGEYLYDGEGKRVKKISASETTIFVYNGGGQLVAEYSTQMAQTPQVSYLTTDHLGSPRVITNENGEVTSRKDYTAFGEENFTAERTANLGYSSQDNLRKGYTGYEKDDESGLDFAQARYYNSTHGRFTSVDPLTASASIRNPQTFNRYSYVLNSPYKFTDPLGLLPMRNSTGGCSAEHSSCSDDWGSTWNEPEPVPEQEETDEGVAENQETEGGDQQQAAEAPPPPAPTAEQNAEHPETNVKPGKINVGTVDVFTEMPKDPEPIRDTGFETPGTKPASSVNPSGDSEGAFSANITAPSNPFFVKVTATVEGDAKFTEENSVPSITANSANWSVVRTDSEGKIPEGRAPVKPEIKISPDGRTITAIFAFSARNSESTSSRFTIGFRATSTQSLAETTLWRRSVNPTAKLSLTISQR
jgi:RHS repeat-associated protein